MAKIQFLEFISVACRRLSEKRFIDTGINCFKGLDLVYKEGTITMQYSVAKLRDKRS